MKSIAWRSPADPSRPRRAASSWPWRSFIGATRRARISSACSAAAGRLLTTSSNPCVARAGLNAPRGAGTLLVPPDQGPDAIGDSNLLALASRITDQYYIGFGTAAAHYGLTTQHRNTIFLVTRARLRGRNLGDSRVRIITQAASKFFGFEPVDALGYKVMMSKREKTAIDCIDHPDLAGGVGEAGAILATASRRFDWNKAVDYLQRIGSGALARRFGWLLDHVNADVPPQARARLLQLAGRSRKTWLGSDPARARAVKGAIGYDETWRVFVNVTADELRGIASLARRKTIKKDR